MFLGLKYYVEQWHMDHRRHQGLDQAVNSQASRHGCPGSIFKTNSLDLAYDRLFSNTLLMYYSTNRHST
jgi:hypothetical protein